MLVPAVIHARASYTLVTYHDPDKIPARRIRRSGGLAPRFGDGPCSFVVDGRLEGTTVANATFYPVSCSIPGGIAGSFVGWTSGAYTVTTWTRFVSWKGYARTFDNDLRGVARDGSILFVSTDEPTVMEDPFDYKSSPGDAWIVRHDHRTDIGPTESASIESDGTVCGYAFRRPNGDYCGESYPYPDARPEAFVWRMGIRHALGDWIPEGRNRKGSMVGRVVPSGQPKLGENAKTAEWLRWRNGHMERLDFSALAPVDDVRLRADDSLLVVTQDSVGKRLLAWREGHTKQIPNSIGGHRLDWKTLWVDRQDGVSAQDAAGRRWRFVRRR